jgi:hypothetical protein
MARFMDASESGFTVITGVLRRAFHDAIAVARCSQELGPWVQAVTTRRSAIADVQPLIPPEAGRCDIDPQLQVRLGRLIIQRPGRPR